MGPGSTFRNPHANNTENVDDVYKATPGFLLRILTPEGISECDLEHEIDSQRTVSFLSPSRFYLVGRHDERHGCPRGSNTRSSIYVNTLELNFLSKSINIYRDHGGSNRQGGHPVSDQNESRKPSNSDFSFTCNDVTNNRNNFQLNDSNLEKNGDIYEQNALRKSSEGWANLSKHLKQYDEERIKRVNDDMDTLLVFAVRYTIYKTVAYIHLLVNQNYGRSSDTYFHSETPWDSLKSSATKATEEYRDLISRTNCLPPVRRILLLWGTWLLYSAPRCFFGSMKISSRLEKFYENDHPFLDERRAREDASMDVDCLVAIDAKFMDDEYLLFILHATRSMHFKEIREINKLVGKKRDFGGLLLKNRFNDAALDCLLRPGWKEVVF
ncbi:hypothetical protein ABKN59_011312, partial [Abortiporus biennis]